jgi:hypothetical protein
MAFPVLSLILATGNLVLWGYVLCVSIGDWRRFHDERSARGVLMSLVLVAASVGSAASALGFLLTSLGSGESIDLVAFLAAGARTAMLAGGVAYIVALQHKGEG